MTFDYVVVFAYRGKERPLDLYSTFDAEDHVLFVSLYQAGPYLLDPFYHAARAPKPGVWRCANGARPAFFERVLPDLLRPDGACRGGRFFVPVSEQVTVVLSLMRREATGVFSATEFALLKKAELAGGGPGAIIGGTRPSLRYGLREKGPGAAEGAHPPADGVWRHLNLTEREAAIIELVLQGHPPNRSIEVGISTGTVKVHRRNVYRKSAFLATPAPVFYIKNLGH